MLMHIPFSQSLYAAASLLTSCKLHSPSSHYTSKHLQSTLSYKYRLVLVQLLSKCNHCSTQFNPSFHSFTKSIIQVKCSIAIMNTGKELEAQIEHNSEQLAEFLASKERLRTRMATVRTDVHMLRSEVTDTRREFDSQLEFLRQFVTPLLPASQSECKAPDAPPSTPAG